MFLVGVKIKIETIRKIVINRNIRSKKILLKYLLENRYN